MVVRSQVVALNCFGDRSRVEAAGAAAVLLAERLLPLLEQQLSDAKASVPKGSLDVKGGPETCPVGFNR